MKTIFYSLLLIFAISTSGIGQTKNNIVVKGELKKWHTIHLLFEGPTCSETDFRPNPFLDYRLEVTFSNGIKSYKIPGFFASDGNSSETGAKAGNKWQVNFVPDDTGTWKYTVSFLSGPNIAINEKTSDGKPISPDGLNGSFWVASSDKKSPDFRSKGRLITTGERYLKFIETGQYFLKGGADSPENFLAYSEFDNTPPKHKYEKHIGDWKTGDPIWHGDKGKGIIGALNYLSSKGVNSVYFLVMNVQGDGNDVFPWADIDERYRFDCSKLDQWEIVFSHMDRLGIMLHIVLSENENQLLLDAGFLQTQRKLFYREMVARFGHHLAVTWNFGEENGPAPWYDNLGQSIAQRKTGLEYLKKINPYPSFIAMHTLPSDPERTNRLAPLLGFKYLDGASLQVDRPKDVYQTVKNWIKLSADSNRQWVVNMDEIGPWHTGVFPDSRDIKHDTIRTEVLWPTLMAGGAGVEWYFGRLDLTTEDFAMWAAMWDQTSYAVSFFQKYLPFWRMKNTDHLVTGKNNLCFAIPGEKYAIYLPAGDQATIQIPEGRYQIKWYNPRSGGALTDGSLKAIKGPGVFSPGNPPSDPKKDWVILISAQQKENTQKQKN